MSQNLNSEDALDSINFYGLLYVDRQRNLDANIKWTMSDPVDIYISCAALLAQSARANGVSFKLLTNKPEYIKRRLEVLCIEGLSLEEMQFSRRVPKVKNFYSAHFKIDAIGALASGKHGKYIALIDIDTVIRRPIPDLLHWIVQTGIAAFDVSSDVVPLYFEDRIRRDLELIADCALEQPRWYGGELLVSTDARLRTLYDEIEICWPRYVKNIKTVHHVGDEMVVSAALNSLAQKGLSVIDIGSKNVIARWWSGRTKHRQSTLAEFAAHAILHLPSDKKFLARQSLVPYSNASFLDAYRKHVRRRNRVRSLFNPIDPWLLAQVE